MSQGKQGMTKVVIPSKNWSFPALRSWLYSYLCEQNRPKNCIPVDINGLVRDFISARCEISEPRGPPSSVASSNIDVNKPF